MYGTKKCEGQRQCHQGALGLQVSTPRLDSLTAQQPLLLLYTLLTAQFPHRRHRGALVRPIVSCSTSGQGGGGAAVPRRGRRRHRHRARKGGGRPRLALVLPGKEVLLRAED